MSRRPALRGLAAELGVEHDAFDGREAVDGSARAAGVLAVTEQPVPAGLSNATTGTPQAMSSSGRYDGCSDTVSATPTSHVR